MSPQTQSSPKVASGTVRLSETGRKHLDELVTLTGLTKSALLEQALAKFTEDVFWTQMNEGFEKYGPELRAELAEFDGTLLDGLQED